MFKFKETSKSTELVRKIATTYSLKIKLLENEIAQMNELLIQDGTFLESIDSNCLEQESLINYCNSDLS